MIGNMIKMAADTGEYGEKKPVPVFFVMNRWNLGKALFRKVAVACVAVLNYQGSDDNFKEMLAMLPGLKKEYEDKLNDAIYKINENLTSSNAISEDNHTLNTDNHEKPDDNLGHTTKCDIKDSLNHTKIDERTVINERMLQILKK